MTVLVGFLFISALYGIAVLFGILLYSLFKEEYVAHDYMAKYFILPILSTCYIAGISGFLFVVYMLCDLLGKWIIQ